MQFGGLREEDEEEGANGSFEYVEQTSSEWPKQKTAKKPKNEITVDGILEETLSVLEEQIYQSQSKLLGQNESHDYLYYKGHIIIDLIIIFWSWKNK